MVTAKVISTHFQHCSSLTEGELRSSNIVARASLQGSSALLGYLNKWEGSARRPTSAGRSFTKEQVGGLFSEFLSGLALCFLSFHFWVPSKPLLRSVQERISGPGVVCRVVGCPGHPSSGIFGAYCFSQTPRDSVNWSS